MTKRTMADVLAQARRESGLSLAEVAEKMKEAEAAGVGRAVSKSMIAYYEAGPTDDRNMEPGAKALEALAWVYGVEVGELYPSSAGAA